MMPTLLAAAAETAVFTPLAAAAETAVFTPLAAAAEPGSTTGAFGTVRTLVTVALLVVGSFFLTIGTVGLLRFPDVYNRLHATSKATTLGAASVFLAGFVHFGPQGAGLTSLIGIVFLFVTAPTGAHMISRSAQRMGVPFFGDAAWPEEETED